MPLRDHFRPPLDSITSRESLRHAWPTVMVMHLNRRLPARFRAEPGVHQGAPFEIDVSTSDIADEPTRPSPEIGTGGTGTGGVALATKLAVWAPPRPTFEAATDLPDQDEFAVLVYDHRRQRRLVAAVEIVSPANKDRPENRQLFVAKCAALLQKRVSIVIVDLVATRHFNLYDELLELIDESGPALSPGPPGIYAVACHWTHPGTPVGPTGWRFKAWNHALQLGQPLPELPLWLADDFAVPLDLEASYEETCSVLMLI
jgi:Protein of unknown function (DUF4058)